MTFDLTYAPMDLSSTLRRAVCLATGTADFDGTTGDVIDPNDVRMGKIFAIHDLFAAVGGVGYIGLFTADNGNGQPAVFWYDPNTGNLAADHVNFAGFGAFPVEVVGQ